MSDQLTTRLATLIADLEQATEGSREFDVLIGYAVDFPLKGFADRTLRDMVDSTGFDWVARAADSYLNVMSTALPHWSTSLDAALTLAPEGWNSRAVRQLPWWCAPANSGKPAFNKFPCDADIYRDGYQRIPLETVSRIGSSSLSRHLVSEQNWGAHGEAHTMPIAFCIAALRART